jgi:hypothetical protein
MRSEKLGGQVGWWRMGNRFDGGKGAEYAEGGCGWGQILLASIGIIAAGCEYVWASLVLLAEWSLLVGDRDGCFLV